MKQRATIRSRRATNSRRRKHVSLSVASATILAANIALIISPRGDDPASAAGELTVALAEDAVLDPHRGGMPASWIAARAIHRGLYAFPHLAGVAGSTPAPDLALALPAVIERGVYEVQVRAAMFSDGTVLTVDDIVASLQRARGTGIGVSVFMAPIERITAVQPATDRRIRIETSRPMPELAWILAHPQVAILPADTRTRVSQNGPPGLGPYRVGSRTVQQRIRLVRNVRWVAANDPIRDAIADRIVFEVGTSGPAALASIERGDANLLGDPGPPDVYPSTARTRLGGRCTRIVAIDHRAPGLDRLAVRRRVGSALLGADLTTGGTEPALGLLPAQVTGARTSQLRMDDRGPRPSRTLTFAGSDTPRDRRELATLATRLRGDGIGVSIELRAPGLHARLLRAPSSRRPDLVLFTWCAEWPGLAGRTFLEALTGPNRLAPRTEEMSAKLSAARTASPTNAAQAWTAAETALHAIAILVPVGWPAEIAAFNGFDTPPATSPMWPAGDPTNLDPAA